MKKTAAIMIFISVLLSLFSCGKKDDLESYYQYGLYYSIPKDFELQNLPYGDLTYSNEDEAYFFFNAFDADELTEDLLQSPDITPVEYTETYILFLLMDIGYKYDKKTNTTTFNYVYSYDGEEGEYYFDQEPEFYMHKILRTEDCLYHVTLTCLEKDRDKYEDLFKRIMDEVSV